MYPRSSAVVALLLLAVALSGCVGGGGPLSADFTATTDDDKTFTFDASASSGSVDKYLWDFGDGNTSEGKVVEHTYEYVDGEYDVTLTVVDSDGVQRDTTKPVMTGSAPNVPPALMATASMRWVKADEPILFDARATTDENGDPFEIEWDFNYDFTATEIGSSVNLGQRNYEQGFETGGNTTGGNESNNGDSPPSLAPPSGDELREAWDRYEQWLAEQDPLSPTSSPRHGGHDEGAPYENPDYKPEFDGRVNSTSPVQFFSWPEDGTYLVRIAAVDIKGDATVGFFAIAVSDEAPESTQQVPGEDGEINYAGPDLPSGLGEEEGTPKNHWKSEPIPFQYPGQLVVNITIVQETDHEYTVRVCLANRDLSQCRSGPDASVTGIQDGTTVTLKVNEQAATKAFRVWVDGGSDSSVSATADINMTGVRFFDTNPWWDVEAQAV